MSERHEGIRQAIRLEALQGRFDPWLIFCTVALTTIGIVMVASSSMSFAEGNGLAPLYFFHRHVLYVALGAAAAVAVMMKADVRRLEQQSTIWLMVGIVLLFLVLVPGLGSESKGASRWIRLGPASFQPAETVKLIMIVWLASYLARFADEVRGSWTSVFKVAGVAGFLAMVLLLLHRDFGTTALLVAITGGMLFLGGGHWPRLALLTVPAAAVLGLFILLEPYRVRRMTSFSNPWEDPFGEGYQLANALMAVGRGEFWGVGLGNSVQKLNFLPDAHTDFILSILAEELGFVGVATVLGLYLLLVGRALWTGLQCVEMRRHFAGYLCFGIALWMTAQVFISMGVNFGILPTKGLTLPLISVGGSSLLLTFIGLGLLLRVSWELERAKRQVALRREGQQPVAPAATPAPQPPAAPEPGEGEDAGLPLWARLRAGWQNATARLAARFATPAAKARPRGRIEPSFGNGRQP